MRHFRKYFNLFIKHLKKDFDLKKSLISCGILFLSFVLVFPTGVISEGTVNEVCANYYADVAKNHTNNVSEKKLSGLVVEPKDGSESKMRQDTETAINELWGVFKGENASFAPVMNTNRDNSIYFADTHLSSECLSLVYTDVGQSSIPYHIKDKGKPTEEIVDYKFQSSPIALMFPSSNSGMQDLLHIYISLAQAERKLIAENKEINKENLEGLTNHSTQIIFNGVEVDCMIDNIYLDNFTHTYQLPNYDYYYATDVGTVLGDFVFVIFYAYKYQSKIAPKKQSLYIMSEYAFRNKFALEYAKESYSPDKFSFDYAKCNIRDGFVFDDNILQNTLKNIPSNIWCSLLTILFFMSFAFSCFLVYRFKLFKQPLSLTMLALSSIFPYLLFKILFLITKSTYIFSSYSLTFNFVLLTLFIVFIVLINCLGRKIIKMENKDA